MLGSKEQRTKGMKIQAQELIDQAYMRGFKAGREDAVGAGEMAYKRGLNDAWECANKLVRMKDLEIAECFNIVTLNTNGCKGIFSHTTASKAIEKIKAYEEQKKADEEEIKVGDEVIYNGMKGIVSRGIYHIGSDAEEFVVIWFGNHMASCSVKNIEPTGKSNSQFVEVLEQLQEGEE